MDDSKSNAVVIAEGRIQRAKPQATMPDKQPGVHRWVALPAHTLTDDQVLEAMNAEKGLVLGVDTMFAMTVGCYDCAKPVEMAWGRPCEVHHV